MPENASAQQGDIRDSQQIADNTTGEGTSRLYQDFMSGNVKESSLTAAERQRLRTEDATLGVRRNTGAESNMLAHLANAVTGPQNFYRLPEGYGESRQDRKIYRSTMLEDLNESRAILQSDGSKLFNGLVKGIGTFVTTAVDAAGIGALAVAGSLIQQGIRGEFKLKPGETTDDMMNRVQYNAQNNAFQRACNDFNSWLEEKAPNYYRRGEQELGFWQSLGNANFWGNDFIKNLGFMVGALVGAKVNGAMMGKLFNLNKSRNVVRSALKSFHAETGMKIGTRTLASAFAAGATEVGGLKITQELGKAALRTVRNEFLMTALSGLIASDVEARQEGSSNSEEFVRNAKARLDEMRDLEKRGIDDRLERERPDLFVMAPDDNPENGMFRGRMTRQVDPDKMEEYGRLRAEMENAIDGRYANMDENVMIEAQKFANADYWANMPILYAENLLLWGSFLKGSYATGRVTNGMIKATKAGKPVVSKLRYVGKIAKGLGSPLYEGAQEFLQENMNQAATKRASARLNTFYGEAFDPKVNADLAEGIQGFLKYVPSSMAEGFTDPNTMKQFYIGTLTAMLGVPSLTHVSRAQNTRAGRRYEQMTPEEKRKWHEDNRSKGKLNAFFKEHAFSIQGEMFDTFREASEEYREAKELVEKYNDITTNDRFRTVYEGVARGQVILRDMDNAVVAGDKNGYITEQEKQLLNIVDTYQRLGRTDELMDTIESFRKSDIGEVRDWSRDAEGKSAYDGVSDAQMRKNIDSWADALEHTVSKYDEIMRNLKVTYGDNVSDSVLTELTWKTFHLDNLNERFRDTYGKVHDWLFGPEGVLNGRADGLFGERMSDRELQDLERLRLIDAKSLLEVASSKEVYDTLNSLGRLVESGGNVSQISPKYDEVREMMEDLSKLYNERIQFADDYLALAADYKNMEAYDVGLAYEVDEARIRSLIAPYVSGVKRFETPKQLNDFLREHSELDGVRVLDELSKYGDYKDLVDRTREWAKAALRLDTAVKASDKRNPFYGRVAEAISRIVNTAQSAEQIRAALEAYANRADLSEGEKALVKDIISRYDEIVKTGKLEEPDPMADEDSEGGRDSGDVVTDEAGEEEPVESAPADEPAAFSPSNPVEQAFSDIMGAKSADDLNRIAEEIGKNGDITDAEKKTLRELVEERRKDLGVTDRTISRAEGSRTGENGRIADTSEKVGNDFAEGMSSVIFSSLDLASLPVKVADVLKGSAEAFVTSGELAKVLKKNPGIKVHFIKLGDRTGDVIYTAIEHKGGSVHAVVDGMDRTFQIIGALQSNKENTDSVTMHDRVRKAFEREFKGKRGGVQVLDGYTTTVWTIGSGYMSRAGEHGRKVSAPRFDPERMSVFVYDSHSGKGIIRVLAGNRSVTPSNIRGLDGVVSDAKGGRGVLLMAVRGADGMWMTAPVETARFADVAGIGTEDTALSRKLNGYVRDAVGATNTVDRMRAAYGLSRYIAMTAEQIYDMAMSSESESAFLSKINNVRLRLDDRLFYEGGTELNDFLKAMPFVSGVAGTDTHGMRIVYDDLTKKGDEPVRKEEKEKKKEEKKPDKTKKKSEAKLDGGEGTKVSYYSSEWSGAIIKATIIRDSKGNIIEEHYKKSGKDVTDPDEIATCNFMFRIKGDFGTPPNTYRSDFPTNGYIATLPSGKEIMYFVDKKYGAMFSTDRRQIDRWKAELDAMAEAATKESAMDDIEEEMDKGTDGEETHDSPRLDDEEREEEKKADDYDRKHSELPAHRTVEYKGQTYAVFDDGRVVNITEPLKEGDDVDFYIDTHEVRRKVQKDAILAALGEETGGPFDTTSDTKTESVPDSEDEHSADEAEKREGMREKGTVEDPLDKEDEPEGPAAALISTMTPALSEQITGEKFRSGLRGLTAKDGSKPFAGLPDRAFESAGSFIDNWDMSANVYNVMHPDAPMMKSESFKDMQEMMDYIDHIFACGF